MYQTLYVVSTHPDKNPRKDRPAWYRSGYRSNYYTLEQVAQVMLEHSWSPIVWKFGKCLEANFIQASGLPIDVDDGLTISDARRILGTRTYIIAPTKSHQRDKKGVTCDRFRIFLPFAAPVTSLHDYKATADVWIRRLQADPAGRSGAHTFMPSNAVEAMQFGQGISVEYPPPRPPVPATHDRHELARRIMSNPARYGGRNRASYIAARCLRDSGRTPELAEAIICSLTDLPRWEIQNCIRSAWRA